VAILDLDAALLAAIAQLAPDAYGVAIRDRSGQLLGGRTPSIGTVYMALTRMEKAKLISARMGDPVPTRGGRAKRLYTLTPAGARALDRARRAAQQRVSAFTPTWEPT
jgi:PadR family transcriptional regulator, regulatory protein PadR